MVGHQNVIGTRRGLRSSAGAGSSAGAWIGIEWVRAAAAVAVVTLHAGVPYATHRMPGLPWSVWDQGSAWVDGLFWSIELFIMPLFLWMAGFFAAETCRRGGPWELVRRRSRRLLRPLAFGSAVLLPAIYYVYMCGWLADGKIAPRSIRSLKFPDGIDADLWGTGHLWFLGYVLSYVILAALMVAVGSRRLTDGRWFRARRWLGSGKVHEGTGEVHEKAGPGPGAEAGPAWQTRAITPPRTGLLWWLLGLYAFGVVVLAFRPQVVWGFQHAWLPVPSKWLYSGTFFAGGWLMAGVDRGAFLLDGRRTLWLGRTRWFGVAVLVAVAGVSLGRWHLDAAGGASGGGGGGAAGWLLAGLTAAAAWGLTLTIVGQAQRRSTSLPPWVGYLSRSSLWVYLAHPPVVALAHVGLKYGVPGWPALPKMAFAAAVGWGFSLLTYEALVRRSAFGRWLQASGEACRSVRPSLARPAVAGGLAVYPGTATVVGEESSHRDGAGVSPGPAEVGPRGSRSRRQAA